MRLAPAAAAVTADAFAKHERVAAALKGSMGSRRDLAEKEAVDTGGPG